MSEKAFIGIDVGSVSTNVVIMNFKKDIKEKIYRRTEGAPVKVLKAIIKDLSTKCGNYEIVGVGTTGSGRKLASVLVGGDVVKNEITAHAAADLTYVPDVKTIVEIGGQDSKIILIENRVVSDFAMNTVCAAGTGSFLDRQASRLNIAIEDFGQIALESKTPVRIAGRCAVFAESDMIHKQQMGCCTEDILWGLCQALVRNYMSNVGKGKKIRSKVVFQGGVAANAGIKKAFEEYLNMPVFVPDNYDVMGAVGAALLAQQYIKNGRKTSFRGFNAINDKFYIRSFECSGCANMCEVIEIIIGDKVCARWGDRCGKWSNNMRLKTNKGVV